MVIYKLDDGYIYSEMGKPNFNESEPGVEWLKVV
jgi:hypothetical protein